MTSSALVFSSHSKVNHRQKLQLYRPSAMGPRCQYRNRHYMVNSAKGNGSFSSSGQVLQKMTKNKDCKERK